MSNTILNPPTPSRIGKDSDTDTLRVDRTTTMHGLPGPFATNATALAAGVQPGQLYTRDSSYGGTRRQVCVATL